MSPLSGALLLLLLLLLLAELVATLLDPANGATVRCVGRVASCAAMHWTFEVVDAACVVVDTFARVVNPFMRADVARVCPNMRTCDAQESARVMCVCFGSCVQAGGATAWRTDA